MKRKEFIQRALIGAGAMLQWRRAEAVTASGNIRISLAEWSLHNMLQARKLDHLDFPAKAKQDFGIDVVEYVNQFFGGSRMNFKDAGKNTPYLKELLQRSQNAGVTNHLIMVDDEGPLSAPQDKVRREAIDNHKKWIEAATFLGCTSIRVNLHGDGSFEEKKPASIESLSRLGEFAAPMHINIIVENHGHASSDGQWVADVMRAVNRPNVGTLPDFGNFCISHPWGSTQEACVNAYDRYKGVEQMLPWAKGVSAKTYDFDTHGEQPLIDFKRLMGIVKRAGFSGYIGVEYEGKKQSEEEGIRLTKKLIEKYL